MPTNNSANRYAVLSAVAAGLPQAAIARHMEVDASTVSRACKKGHTEWQGLTVQGYKQESREWHDLAFQFWLDTDLPTLSGRKFRLLCQPKDEIFQEYTRYCAAKGYPAYRRSKFYEKLLLERIHKSRAGVPCSDCALVALVDQASECEQDLALTDKQKKRLPKARKHVRAVPIQRGYYREDRANLKDRELLIVQDFTKHDKDINTTTQQDHIVVMYWKEGGAEHYIMEHYIGPEGLKNDVRFSMHVWILLQHHQRVLAATRLIVWSDNGPKHFKLSAYMSFMSQWSSVMGKPVSLRFNTPYHGACVADSAAAHLKMATRRHIDKTGDNMKDPASLVSLANELRSHSGVLLALSKSFEKPSVKTWEGITRYYHWEALGEGTMHAWETTKDYNDDVLPQRYDPDAGDFIPYVKAPEDGRLAYCVM